MRISSRRFRTGILFVAAGLVVLSCGPKPVMKINYQPPETSKILSGMTVAVAFEDQRPDASILDTNARHEIRNFTGQFSYNINTGTETREVGIYDLPVVMEKTLKERLTRMGANVSEMPVEPNPQIVIVLKKFNVTFDDRIWSAAINYEAQLKTEGKIRAREKVSGSGTRVKIVGSGDADKLLSSVYSDVINQLNVEKLFKRSDLLK